MPAILAISRAFLAAKGPLVLSPADPLDAPPRVLLAKWRWRRGRCRPQRLSFWALRFPNKSCLHRPSALAPPLSKRCLRLLRETHRSSRWRTSAFLSPNSTWNRTRSRTMRTTRCCHLAPSAPRIARCVKIHKSVSLSPPGHGFALALASLGGSSERGHRTATAVCPKKRSND